jgi:hypothetical protein
VDASTLEGILERLPDVDDVTVTSTTDTSLARIWKVTFNTGVDGVSNIAIGTSGLISTNSETGIVCTKGVSVASTGSLECQSDDSVSGASLATSITFYKSGDGNCTAVDSIIGSSGFYSYVIDYLVQNSANTLGYGVRVYATNYKKWNSISTDSVYLKPMAVADAPKYTEVLRAAGSDSAAMVYWSFIPFPNDRGSPVTSFVVQWCTELTFAEADEAVLTVGEATNLYRQPDSANRTILSYNITDMTPGTSYYVRVAGINVMGVGEWSVSDFEQFDTQLIAPFDKPAAIPLGSVRLDTVRPRRRSR